MAEPLSSFDPGTLVSLSEAFQNFRASSGKVRPSFPLPLRRRALETMRTGAALASVSTACGVAPQTLRNWAASIPPSPRRLSVAPTEMDVLTTPADPERVTKIPSKDQEDAFEFHLACGVSLEASPQQTLWLIRALGGAR